MKYTLSEVAEIIEKTWGKTDIAHWLRYTELINNTCGFCFHDKEHHLELGGKLVCSSIRCSCTNFDSRIE